MEQLKKSIPFIITVLLQLIIVCFLCNKIWKGNVFSAPILSEKQTTITLDCTKKENASLEIFLMDKHYAIIHFLTEKIIKRVDMYSSKTGKLSHSFSKSDMNDIFSLLYKCIKQKEPCFFLRTKTHEPSNNVVCNFYSSKVITVCFSYDGYISGGFIGSTIFTRNDIVSLFKIALKYAPEKLYK